MEYRVGEMVFNDWEIVREIGSGASGQVWEIVKKDHDISISSALKVIHVPKDPSLKRTLYGDGMDERSITTFFQDMVDDLTDEIKIMTDMKGFPHIVNCEDYKVIRYENEIQWDILIRMELLMPIQAYIQEHAISEADVLRMSRELVQTLELFESKGIIHRDIKLDNIFVDNYGNFKIGDFGIARICDKASADLSKKGTENYMAPEVFHGKDYDHTVDIYSLGLVLYKLLNNNRLPFYPETGSYSEWDMQQALIDRLSGKKELPPPCAASEEFGKIVLRMCAHDPAERYQNAKEILADLEQITGSKENIAGMAVAPETASGSSSSKSLDETRAMFQKDVFIYDAETVKKTSKTNITGNSIGKSTTIGTTPPPEKKEKKPETPPKKPEAKKEPKKEPVKEKKSDKKKVILQGLAGSAVAVAVLAYFLTNQTYTLAVEDGSGSGKYKGGQKVTVTAKDVDGSTFVKWEIDGKLSLTDEELSSQTISFKMPRHEIQLAALYDVNSHQVIINNGSGSGEYNVGEEITIVADDPAAGSEFAGWDVEDGTVYLEHADKQKTSFEMPDDELEITATYKTLSYELQVENGQGGGTYEFGETARTTAQEKAGATFKGWVVKEGELELSEEEAASPELTISMPAADVVLAAEYDQNQHQVTINGGSGSGSYLVGETVTLVADEAGTGKEFTGWEVEEGAVSIQNANKQKASFEMPDGELVINAIFKDIDYKVSVNDGDGSGTYHYGDQVQVTAKDSNNGVPFSHWTIDKGTLEISDLTVQNLTFAMPAEEVAMTAHYAQEKFTLKVDGGKGSGMYDAGSTATITADETDASGVPFARWEVTEGSVTLENAESRETSFTMPSEKVSVKAVYEAGDRYSVMVFGGTGAGIYEEGEIVTVTATEEPGKKFNCWYISADGSETVENDNASFSFEMPATDLIITAMYDLE